MVIVVTTQTVSSAENKYRERTVMRFSPCSICDDIALAPLLVNPSGELCIVRSGFGYLLEI